MHIGNMAILISLVAKRGDATRKAVTVVPSSPFLSILVCPRKQIFWALHCNLLAADTDKYQGGYQELDIESRTDNQSGCRFRPPSGPRTRRPFSPHESPSGSGRTGRTDEPKRCHLLSLPSFCSITFRSQSPLRPTTRHRTDGGGDAQQRRWRQGSSARLRSEISRSTGHDTRRPTSRRGLPRSRVRTGKIANWWSVLFRFGGTERFSASSFPCETLMSEKSSGGPFPNITDSCRLKEGKLCHAGERAAAHPGLNRRRPTPSDVPARPSAGADSDCNCPINPPAAKDPRPWILAHRHQRHTVPQVPPPPQKVLHGVDTPFCGGPQGPPWQYPATPPSRPL